MDIKKIKKSNYNPRVMSRDARVALRKSLESFNDISGIVVNTTTGNLVSGNHRWDELCQIHDEKNLSLREVTPDIFSIDAKKKATGFILRTVKWPLSKEKAANIAANSDLLMGEFTSGLQGILDELFDDNELDINLEDLRFEELSIDTSALDDDLDLDDESVREKIQTDSEAKIRKLKEATTEPPGEVKVVVDSFKIICPGEICDEVKEDIKKYVSKKYYKDDIKIV